MASASLSGSTQTGHRTIYLSEDSQKSRASIQSARCQDPASGLVWSTEYRIGRMRVRLAHSPTRTEVTPRNSLRPRAPRRELKVGVWMPPNGVLILPRLPHCWWVVVLPTSSIATQYPNHHSAQANWVNGIPRPTLLGLGEQGLMANSKWKNPE